MSRVDDAVRRILRVKAALGLLAHLEGEGKGLSPQRGGHGGQSGGEAADRQRLTAEAKMAIYRSVGCASHRGVARAAVSKSLVVLRNENQTLPLDPAGCTAAQM